MAIWACASIGLWAAVPYLQPPDQSLAWVTFFDAGHAPLFGAIALVVFQLLLATPLANRSRPLLYGLALGLTVIMGAASEYFQLGANRNSDPRDFMRDSLGACSFLLLAATCDPHALYRAGIGDLARAIWRGAALVLLIVAFIPGIRVAHAYFERAAAFPALLDFTGTWETHFVERKHVRLEFIEVPLENGGTVPAAHIRFSRIPFAGFRLIEPYPDWTDYQRLKLVAQLDFDRPIDLALKIYDRIHDGRYSDRFNGKLTLQPGLNEIEIPLSEIRSAPEGREMDLSAIARLNLFAVEPERGVSLYLLELGLN
jgi:hypothetical protein